MKQECGIDFLSFTLFDGGIQEAFKILGETPEKLVNFETGFYGYKLSWRCPGVMILYSPGRNEVHIQLTGMACEFYGEKLLTMVPENSHVTRLDLRCDVYDGVLTVDDIWGYLQRGHYKGQCRTISTIQTIKQDQYAGATIYIGSKASDVRLRIYDKGAEQKTSDNPLRWNRFEFQLRHEVADYLYNAIKETNESEQFYELIYKTLTLTEKSFRDISEGHRNRLTILKEWEFTFGQKIAKVKYRIIRKMSSYEGMLKSLKNVGAIMKVIRSVRADWVDIIDKIMEDAKLKEKHVSFAWELKKSSIMLFE